MAPLHLQTALCVLSPSCVGRILAELLFDELLLVEPLPKAGAVVCIYIYSSFGCVYLSSTTKRPDMERVEVLEADRAEGLRVAFAVEQDDSIKSVCSSVMKPALWDCMPGICDKSGRVSQHIWSLTSL